MRKLLLISNSTQHGGGFLEYCADEIRDFLGASVKSLVFVPFALADHDGYAKKAGEAFRKMGYETTSLHEVVDPSAAVEAADGMFVGGGNTFRLLRTMQRLGLIEPIRNRVTAGMPYMGASAGSNLACPTIKTTNDMPIVQPDSFAALGLVPFQINPHYQDPDPDSRHMGETREQRIREFHEENAMPVIGLREGTMLRVEGQGMTLRGPRPARVFRRDEDPVEHPPGSDLSVLLRTSGA
jgi:dipeptidase E